MYVLCYNICQTLTTPFGDCVITPLVLESVPTKKRILNKCKKTIEIEEVSRDGSTKK